jgi:hypothetical protein
LDPSAVLGTFALLRPADLVEAPFTGLSNTKHKLFVHKHLAAAAVFFRDFLEKHEKALDRAKQMF